MDNQEDSAMGSATTTVQELHDDPAPIAPAADRTVHGVIPQIAFVVTVEIDGSTLHIRDLITERASIVGYLRAIAPSKQEIALLHALEVGITELAARRERFRH